MRIRRCSFFLAHVVGPRDRKGGWGGMGTGRLARPRAARSRPESGAGTRDSRHLADEPSARARERRDRTVRVAAPSRRRARREKRREREQFPAVRFSEKIVRGSHLFEYDGAGAWNIALLMSDTCSAQDDSKGSSPRILSSLLFFLPRPAQKLPHMFRARKGGTRRQTSQDAALPVRSCRERTGGTRLTRRAAGRRAVNDAPERSPARNLERSKPYGSFRRATRRSGSDRRVLSRAQWPGERGACRICRIFTSDPRGNRVTIGAAPGARAGSRAAVGRPRFR